VKLIFDQLSVFSEEFAACSVAAVEPDTYADLAFSVGCISDCISARTLIASPTSFTVSSWRCRLTCCARARVLLYTVKRGFEPFVERAVSLLGRLLDQCIVPDDDKLAALLGKCLIVFNQMSGLGLEPVRFISPARLLSYARTAMQVTHTCLPPAAAV
jgi:hypothetical protein